MIKTVLSEELKEEMKSFDREAHLLVADESKSTNEIETAFTMAVTFNTILKRLYPQEEFEEWGFEGENLDYLINRGVPHTYEFFKDRGHEAEFIRLRLSGII